MERSQITTYINANKERFLNELLDLLKIPSISADAKYSGDVNKTAEAVKQRLIEAGVENVEISKTKGYPVVYGDKLIDPKLPTIIVYGHYDVQPPDPLELWIRLRLSL